MPFLTFEKKAAVNLALAKKAGGLIPEAKPVQPRSSKPCIKKDGSSSKQVLERLLCRETESSTEDEDDCEASGGVMQEVQAYMAEKKVKHRKPFAMVGVK